tara:strand:- start:130 stop:831 length:702 start_codon:yes stop_codon:yes gene_type:complete
MDFSTVPVKKAKGTRNVLNAQPNSPFIYMFHPNSWDYVFNAQTEEFEWLPRLRKWRQIAGINGIRDNRSGGIDESIARARFISDGWQFIEPEACEWVDNQPGDLGYLRNIEVRDGRVRGSLTTTSVRHVDIWTIPEQVGFGRNAPVNFSRDKEGYNEFRRQLLKRGMIAPIHTSVAKMYTKRQRNLIDRRRNQVHNPIVAARLEEQNRKLEAMTSPPKRKRGRPAKGSKDVGA